MGWKTTLSYYESVVFQPISSLKRERSLASGLNLTPRTESNISIGGVMSLVYFVVNYMAAKKSCRILKRSLGTPMLQAWGKISSSEIFVVS